MRSHLALQATKAERGPLFRPKRLCELELAPVVVQQRPMQLRIQVLKCRGDAKAGVMQVRTRWQWLPVLVLILVLQA